MSENETLMTPLELAAYLKKSKSWVYAACERGELPATRIGRDLRFKREEIDRWVASRTQRPKVATLKAEG
jgi:excisionase family DNA binding protein